MIVITFSNWRKKLKIAALLFVFLIIVILIGTLLVGGTEETTVDELEKERSPNGSLKVETQENSGWIEQFAETLQDYSR